MAIYTPDTEPYLGRPLLHHFDDVIVASLEQHHAIRAVDADAKDDAPATL